MTHFLESRNITKAFGGSGLFHKKETVALEAISLVIKENPASIIGIAGESGSGKTTLARIIAAETGSFASRLARVSSESTTPQPKVSSARLRVVTSPES